MELKKIDTGEEFTLIALSGILDISGVQEVEMEFSEMTATGQSMIVNLSEVTFLASLGMRMLLSAAKKLNASGKKLVLLSPQSLVKLALETAGLESIIPIVSDLNEAVKLIEQ
ncbi:MAG: STAS domain-containing protein [Victivallaceae bacterium]